jgi:hypothetical protein
MVGSRGAPVKRKNSRSGGPAPAPQHPELTDRHQGPGDRQNARREIAAAGSHNLLILSPFTPKCDSVLHWPDLGRKRGGTGAFSPASLERLTACPSLISCPAGEKRSPFPLPRFSGTTPTTPGSPGSRGEC